jgi:hypothetical protein
LNNNLLDNLFVPSEELERIIDSSYEVIIGRLEEKINESKDLFGNGDGEFVEIVATFPNYVVVITPEGKFLKTWYKIENDRILFGRIEDMKIPIVRKEDVKNYVSRKTVESLDNFVRNSNNGDSCNQLHDDLFDIADVMFNFEDA